MKPRPIVQRHVRREPPVWMAIPPGMRRQPPDNPWLDVAVIGWGIAFLLFIYWMASMGVVK